MSKFLRFLSVSPPTSATPSALRRFHQRWGEVGAAAFLQLPRSLVLRLPAGTRIRWGDTSAFSDTIGVPSRATLAERFPRPSVMGVVNVTPDSFSDGGVHLNPDAAVAAARRMVETGAAVVDVGGESTRPGSGRVTLANELRRVVPVLERLEGVPLSIDTTKAEVARQALELGAELVNDVSALRGDAKMASVIAESGAYVCLMHMRSEPRTMQVAPTYDDVVDEVAAFLEERLHFAVAAGIDETLICLDPGIGFGKTVEQNLELVRRLPELATLGPPLLIGFSRKASLGRILGDPHARTGPIWASVAAAVTAYERGATIVRAHDVRETVEALTIAAAVAG